MFAVNHLGHLPFNPDLLLDTKRVWDRPVGLTLPEITKLYWTVKSFKVSLNIISYNEVNAFEEFMLAGGSFGLVGAMAATSVVQKSIGSQQPIVMDGYTKIYSKYQKTVRNEATNIVPFEGASANKFIKGQQIIGKDDFKKDEKINKPNPLVSINLKPNEGALCSAGPVHKLMVSNKGNNLGTSYLVIDFSDIIYYNRLYWPKIHFHASSNNLSFSFNSLGDANVMVFGGISFYNGALIPIWGYTESFGVLPGGPTFALGSIDIGHRCCDRFYWDGKDDVREKGDKDTPENSECKKDCSQIYFSSKDAINQLEKGTAEYQKDKDRASAEEYNSGGFVGGGGKSGGGGASSSY